VLTVVGDVDPDAIRRWTEQYFGGIPANPSIPKLGDLSLPPILGAERREIVHDKIPLPRVYVGFRAPAFGDDRLDALDIAAQILAGGKGSRLHRRLVRDERIAQDVALVPLGFVGGASIVAGWATVRPGVAVERVEAALHEELELLGRELITDDELARARALIETEELGGLSRVEERADRLSMYATLFDDPELINRMLPRYLSITPEQIQSVAAETFRADNRVVLTYLPELPPAETASRDDAEPAEASDAATGDDAADEEVAA
jgi:predicted Zn-dependent peptidase